MTIRELFGAVADEPNAATRACRLAELGADEAACAEVERLLAARQIPLPLLDGLPSRSPKTPAHGAVAIAAGEFVPDFGPRYGALEKIGEGGMGTVFSAEQREPVRRKVALKVLKPGTVSPLALARFEAEREALSLLDGPGFARVHDYGTTREGLPFLAMDWIDGEPLTRHCHEQSLPREARVALLAAVCEIVHTAHRKGLIHRDLKPSNVL